ncbi:MAG: helix-turn-helix domain-containing protein [Halorientalis sp.]
MKYATLSLAQDPGVRHPMHQFVVEREGFERTRLLGSAVTGGVHTALFHVEGWPPEPYEDALSAVGTVEEYALARQSEGTFSVYVRERLRDSDRELTDALGRIGLVVLFPVVYRADGTVRVTLVGPGATLQSALENTPEGVTADVRDIGAYDARRVGGGRALTDRQAEAVAAAVDCGYYDDPRAGSVADVAEALGCAPSTAAEHLRRAERTAMADRVSDRMA